MNAHFTWSYVDPCGGRQTYQTTQLSGTYTFEVLCLKGGAATLTVSVIKPSGTSTLAQGIWLPPCEGR